MPPPPPRSEIDHTKRPLPTCTLPPEDACKICKASGWGRGCHICTTPQRWWHAHICDVQMTYQQAGRLTDASWPSFCASEHLTDKVGNLVEAGLTVWKDSTLLGHSKVFRVRINTCLCYYF